MNSTLIIGCDEVLGIELAAQLLKSGADRVLWIIGEAGESVEKALSVLVNERAQDDQDESGSDPAEDKSRTRLRIVGVQSIALRPIGVNPATDLQADEVWCLDGWDLTIKSAVRSSSIIETVASLLGHLHTRVINCVRCVYRGDGDHVQVESADEIREYCGSEGISYRAFHLGIIVGDRYVRPDSGGWNILCLLHPLDEVIEEVRERLPEFFDFYALRIFTPPQCVLNLIPVRAAVELMLRNATEKRIAHSEYHIVSPENTSVEDFCERVGDAYSISFLATNDMHALNAVDRLFGSRMEKINLRRNYIVPRDLNCQRADFPETRLVVRDDLQRNMIASVRRQQATARAQRDVRVAQVAAAMQHKNIIRPNGELTYFSTRSEGLPVLILNAMGQGLDYWYRLIDQLMGHNRVFVWETRGFASDSVPLRLADHVEDVKAILDEERYDACFLVGWCTGTQVAMEFYRLYPNSVLGMAFLNSGLKVPERPDLETPYTANLETLCASINSHPAFAPSVMNSLSAPSSTAIDLAGDTDADQVAADVLSITNTHLRTSVIAPFRTVDSTMKYAAQILDLASTETLAKTFEISVPTLVVGCEYDKVALAAKSAEIAVRFPNSTHVQLPGATHYALYDRPTCVAKLLLELFARCCRA